MFVCKFKRKKNRGFNGLLGEGEEVGAVLPGCASLVFRLRAAPVLHDRAFRKVIKTPHLPDSRYLLSAKQHTEQDQGDLCRSPGFYFDLDFILRKF